VWVGQSIRRLLRGEGLNSSEGGRRMNTSTHAAAGAVVGGIAYLGLCKLVDEEPGVGGFLLSVGFGAAAACLHDVLEPAVHPNHRALIHGVALNLAGAAGLRHLWRRTDVELAPKAALVALGLACLTHPILDAMTPKGLPLLF
jgi:inner membrane protein